MWSIRMYVCVHVHGWVRASMCLSACLSGGGYRCVCVDGRTIRPWGSVWCSVVQNCVAQNPVTEVMIEQSHLI